MYEQTFFSMLFFEIREKTGHMMRTKIRKSIAAAVALAIMAVCYIGLNGFMGATLLEEKWYFITDADPDTSDKSDQIIASDPSDAEPQDESCNLDNQGNPCAVKLSFPGTAPSLSSLPANTSVQKLIDSLSATVVENGTEEMYTRHPEN